MQFGRRSTREIAIYNEGRLDARIEADKEHHARVEQFCRDSQATTERMHAENKASNAATNTKIDIEIGKVHARIDGLVWKIVGWQTLIITGLVVAAAAVLGWLATAGPWAPH